MIPVFINPGAVRILLVGRGPLLSRRLAGLLDLGARPEVFADGPQDFDGPYTERLPSSSDFAAGQLVWIAGIDDAAAEDLATAARRAGALVNVEDRPHLCDFHTPAILRRGRLTLAAGTGGASPAAARFVREKLEAHFPPEWEEALDEVARARADLRDGHASFEALSADARERLSRRGLI